MFKEADKTLSFAKLKGNSNAFYQNHCNTETTNFYLPKDSKESKEPSETNKLNLRSSTKIQQSNECKLLKLIGNMEENIGSIIQNLNCICCGKYQFQKIVRLMMSKIYQLRQERNFYKNEYQMLQGSIFRSKKVIQDLKNELSQYQKAKSEVNVSAVTKHKNTSLIQQNSIEMPNYNLSHQRLNSSLNLSQTSRRQENASIVINQQNDETNLLQQSSTILDKNLEDQELLKMSLQEKENERDLPLKQMSTNNFNSIQGIKSYMKKHSMSLQDLQKYIQKMNCMNQLQLDQIRNHKKLLI